MMKKIFILLFLFHNNIILSQIGYTTHIDFGISRLDKIDWEDSYEIVNYTWKPSVGIGGNIYYRKNFFNHNFKFISGLDIKFYQTKVSWKRDFLQNEIKNFNINHYAFDVPLQISYDFEKWLYINAGVSGRLIFYGSEKDKYLFKNYQKYNLAFIGGFDVYIKRNIFLRLNYYHDLYSVAHDINFNIDYFFQQINFGIGYQFK